MNGLIYLDNAATTFPKPASVISETVRCMETYGGNPGRSSHRLSLAAAAAVYDCRAEIAALFGSDAPENVVFTLNDTYALNIAIRALTRENSHILISNIEHNSVIRTVRLLEKEKHCSVSVFNVFENSPDAVIAGLSHLIRKNTSMIIVSAASNICGVMPPVGQIGDFCRRHGLKFIVDAAQSAGSVPTDIEKDGIDALCAPGHKGLFGLQGSGFVIFSKKYADVSALREFAVGGNGIAAFESGMPGFLPERYEAGTLPTPAIAGLCEGIRFVRRNGLQTILAHETSLKKRITENLSGIGKVRIYAGDFPSGGTVLFNIGGISSEETAKRLDGYGICVRGGFHCSPLAHTYLGTGDSGAVRASVSFFNTEKDADALCRAVKEISEDQ